MADLPVVIAGAGPTGLCLALALRRADIDAVVLEQRPRRATDHRATTLQPPSLELFERWGVLDDVRRDGLDIRALQYWDWSHRALLADLDYRRIADDTSCPYRVHLHQHELCAILEAHLERDHPGTLRYGHKVVGFADHGERVTVTERTRDGEQRPLEARWLVAADGHASSIREQLAIPWQAHASAEAFLTCETELSVLRHLPGGIAPVSYLFGSQGWAMMMVMTSAVRFLFRSPASASALSAEAMSARARALLGPGADEALQSLALYTVRPGVAERFRAGRVVLAGDAAHSAYPVGGTAMNAGIHDAHHLAVALEGSEGAVERYAHQRHAWTTEQLVAHATESMRALSARGPFRRLSRNRYLRRLAADPEQCRAHLLRVSMLEDRLLIPTIADFE